jgi:APA family basic amino acid/polyamine antiporter
MNSNWQPKAGDKVFHPRRFFNPRLRRILGVPGLFSAAYGNVGSSIYYALGVVAMSALGFTPIVLVLSGILFLFTGLTYAEGSTSLPEAGGSGAFARRAFNDLVSFIASWVLMIDYIVTIAISAFTAANYLGHFFPVVSVWPMNSTIGIVIIAGLVLVNIRGIQESSRLNVSLIVLDIITQVAVAILGVLLIINIPVLIKNIHWGVAPTTSQLLFGISISMVAYTGIETVANLGSEARNPSKSIPRTILLVFVTVLALYTLLSMTAMSAYPVHQDATGAWVTDLTRQYLEDPVLGIANAMPLAIRPFLSFWVAILAITILIIATNAGIIGASRLAYFMGLRRQLPPFISQISTKSRVPRNAIILFSVMAAILTGIGKVTMLADLYAFGAMFAYTVAHLSVIALRIKEPNLLRPFKIPVNVRVRQWEIPVTSILGFLGTGITWFIVVYTHELGRIIGFGWMALGLIIYIVYRRSTHQSIINVSEEKK